MLSLHRIRPFSVVLTTILLCSLSAAAAGEISDLAAVSQDRNVVNLRSSDGALVRLTFLADGVLRIQAAATGVLSDEGSLKAPIVLDSNWPEVLVKVEKTPSSHKITSSTLELTVHQTPLTLDLRRLQDGTTLWRELKPLDLSEKGSTQTLSSDSDEHFFGGGQQNGVFQFKGRLMEISYSGGWEEGDRPNPAPFFMSDRGYGILRNTWTDGVYDFRSDGYLTATHAENRFDAYIMVGDSIQDVLNLYTRLTGRAGLLPRWAFGFGDADCYNDGDNVNKPGTVPENWSDGPTGTTPDVITSVAGKYREHDMPASWILPNDGYGCGYTNLPEVVKGLGNFGFQTGLWTEDGVEKIAWEVGTAGTRVQKLDVAWTGEGYQWAMDACKDAADGILKNSDSRPFIWTVMGWAGIQRYAVTWTGDQSGGWDFIRWHVPTLIGSGLSGMNYSTGDVDGIFGGSPETFTRDLQWKCFTPVLMGMSGWSKVERKHPWWFDEPHRSIHRRYLKLRQRLMPYLYTLAHHTETSGAPMVRGLMWDYPTDPHAFDHPNQFFLGRDLLIAPVYRSQAASGGWRQGVYLPEGRWIDYWNGSVIEAGANGLLIDVPVDLATIPVMVRAGAILPMYPESLYDGQVPPDPLSLDIYPFGESEFLLYEDDGTTREYRDGHYSQQRFSVSVTDQGQQIEVMIDPASGRYDGILEDRALRFELHVSEEPTALTLDGSDLAKLAGRPSLDSDEIGWFYDHSDRGGLLVINAGSLNARRSHRVIAVFQNTCISRPGPGYPPMPTSGSHIPPDELMVVGRPAEEPGHPLENAFDGDPDTWFRTVRDQSVAYGPHEFVVSLGQRRVIEGFTIQPRNDKHWKYGQVREYEIYISDINGLWGEPVATGTLDQLESDQQVSFRPTAGRLLRFRILSTHDDGADPMVLNTGEANQVPFDAQAQTLVGPTTISEFQIEERTPPDRLPYSETPATNKSEIRIDGLQFQRGIRSIGDLHLEYLLEGDWHTLRAEVGLEDNSPTSGTARFQVWGNGVMLWDSGSMEGSTILKPHIDIRGISLLGIRTVATDQTIVSAWVDVEFIGYEGDQIAPLTGRPTR